MRLINSNDPEQRRKAAIHYSKIARQAQRQMKRRAIWTNLTHTPYFAFVDMILVAIASAVLAMGFTALYMR